MIKFLKIFLLLLAISYQPLAFSQNPDPQTRSTSGVTAVDVYLRVRKTFGLPIQPDTTLDGGLDSLGSMLYVSTAAKRGMWLRDSVVSGGHKWTLLGASSYTFTPADFNQSGITISFDYTNGQKATALQPGLLTAADWIRFDAASSLPPQAGQSGKFLTTNGATTSWGTVAGSGTVTNVSVVTANGISGTVATGTTTPAITLTLQNAAADGTTKGQATFTPADFNTITGLLSLDYTNGQAASRTTKGYVTATDWDLFNSKADSITGAITPILNANLTTNRVLISNGFGKVAVSGVTTTTLGYLDATSSIQTQLDAKQTATLASGKVLFGNGSNVATAVTISGDITFSNAGVGTLASSGAIAGSYTNPDITVNAKGIITAIANGSGGGGGGAGTMTSFTFTNSGGFTGTVTGATTAATLSLALQDAAADGTTKGKSTYAPADFNSITGLISLDYVNGVAGSSTVKGYIIPVDWARFNAKAPAITGGATTIATTNLGFNFALISSATGKVAVSVTTAAQLSYLSTLRSDVQVQIDNIVAGGTKAFQALTDGGTVSWVYGNGFNARFTIGGTRTLSITGDVDGDYGTLIITQDAIGSRDINVPAGDKLLDGIGTGTLIDLADAANSVSIISYIKRGTIRYFTKGYYH